MIFYLCFGLSFLLFSSAVRTECDDKSRKFVGLLFFFIVFLFMGLRSPEVGNDSMQFYQAYTRIKVTPWTNYTSERYEFGFFALCKGLGIFFPHPQTLFLFTGLVFAFSVYRFIRMYSNNIALSCVLFLFLNLWAVYMNLIRQILALCIILYFLDALFHEKRLQFCLGVFLASLFHRSALVCLVMLVFYKKPFKKKFLIFYIPFTAFCFWKYDWIFTLGTIILHRYEGYRFSQTFGASNYFGMLFHSLICFSILFYGVLLHQGKEDKTAKGLTPDFQIYMLLCCLFCYTLGMRMYILSRITPYFTIFYLTWFGEAQPFVKMEKFPLENIPKDNSNFILKRIYPLESYFIVLVSSAYFCIVHLFRPEWQGVVPYRFFWQ